MAGLVLLVKFKTRVNKRGPDMVERSRRSMKHKLVFTSRMIGYDHNKKAKNNIYKILKGSLNLINLQRPFREFMVKMDQMKRLIHRYVECKKIKQNWLKEYFRAQAQ